MPKTLILALALAAAAIAAPALAQPHPRPAPANLPDTRAGAVERLASELQDNYTIPEIGRQYAAALRAHLAAGDYDKAADTRALAKQLTLDVQAVHPDRHIRVALDDDRPGGPGQAGGPPRPMLKGVEEAKWLEPGIAYIRFDLFSGSPEEVAAVKAFMAGHASAKAIIIDARGHHGGGLAEMNVMLPYLYPKKTVLVDMDVSRAVAERMGDPLDDDGLVTIKGPAGIIRREHVVTPNPTEHRLFKAKVFYLTSTHTGSAAEHLALAFKRTHRAVLVGEHTAGANHFGGDEPLGLGLVAFIPVGRTFDPDTGKDWEGTGILPDVAVPADQALDVALKLAKR
jgi:hypothetical protein